MSSRQRYGFVEQVGRCRDLTQCGSLPRVAASVSHTVFFGAGRASGLVRNGRSATVAALAAFLGSLMPLLSIASMELFSFRGLVSSSVVLDSFLPGRFRLDMVRYGRLFSCLCFWCRCVKGFSCSSLFVTLGPAAALVGRPWQGECKLEGIPYCPLVRVRVSTTSARDYMTLLAGRAA